MKAGSFFMDECALPENCSVHISRSFADYMHTDVHIFGESV